MATSTAEAEYRAAVISIGEICLVRRVKSELGIVNLNLPTTLYVKNQSTIHMLKNAHEGKVTRGYLKKKYSGRHREDY